MNPFLIFALIPLILSIGIIPISDAEESKTILINSYLVDCVGVGPQKCMEVRDDPYSEWNNFYDNIEGFTFTEGYTYELSVKITNIENPPADASSKKYELLEIIKKNPITMKYCSSHVSPEWCDFYNSFTPSWDIPEPDDIEGWEQYDLEKSERLAAIADKAREKYPVTIVEKEISGVRVLEIIPDNLKSDKVLLHTHGGAWVSLSPESLFGEILPITHGTGMKTISVDYIKMPKVTLEEVIDQNVAVFKGMVDSGINAQDIGIFGCSAGGHLAAATAYNAREQGYGLAGALVSMSPMLDFTMSGESWYVVEGWDVSLSRENFVRKLPVTQSLDDPKNPKISVLHGDLSKGMPPTLIIVGSKEILLSDSIVFYQEMEKAGQTAKLDIYEGLPHCFFEILPEAPESKIAVNKQISWLTTHPDPKTCQNHQYDQHEDGMQIRQLVHRLKVPEYSS